jgi:hypothetical protein
MQDSGRVTPPRGRRPALTNNLLFLFGFELRKGEKQKADLAASFTGRLP